MFQLFLLWYLELSGIHLHLFLDKNILECQFANLYYYPKRYVSLYK